MRSFVVWSVFLLCLAADMIRPVWSSRQNPFLLATNGVPQGLRRQQRQLLAPSLLQATPFVSGGAQLQPEGDVDYDESGVGAASTTSSSNDGGGGGVETSQQQQNRETVDTSSPLSEEDQASSPLLQQGDGVETSSTSNAGRAFLNKRDRPFLKRYSLKRHAEAFGQQIDQLFKNNARKNISDTNPPPLGDGGNRAARRLLGSVVTLGPSLAAVFANKKGGQEDGVSFLALYALAMLGSSAGFYLFLYFISIGYAAGIALPLFVALIKLSFFRSSTSTYKLTFGTQLHSWLVLLWGIRSIVFFVWREYKSWPALHAKVVTVNRIKSPPILIKVLCWFVYSFLYVCMLSPCWFRLEHDISSTVNNNIIKSGGLLVKSASRMGLLLQIFGLVLESVADWQKSIFKASSDPSTGQSQRHQWCHVGVWKWSTHPNYAGEWLFWLGTFLQGIGAIQNNPVRFVMMAAGLAFISLVLRGATIYLTEKHWEKYGSVEEFVDFRNSHCVFGPKWWLSLDQSPKAVNEEQLRIPNEEEQQQQEQPTA